MDESRDSFFIPGFQAKIKKMSFYRSGRKVEYSLNDYGLLFRVPEQEKDPVDTIIVLELHP